MVLSAYGQGPPPAELQLAWECQRWNSLPEQGAYLDQDYGLMTRMTGFVNIYNVLQKWQNLEGKQIHSLTDSERRLLGWLKDKGLIFQ